MKEVVAMWRMVRAVQMWKTQFARHEIEAKQPNPTNRREEFAGYLRYNKEPRVKRGKLIHPYLMQSASTQEYAMENVEFEEWARRQFDDRVKEKWLEAHSVIQSCLDHKPPYLNVDGTDDSLVYLTTEGKQFSGRFGL